MLKSIMRFNETRDAIVREWLERDPEKRQSEQQAATFVANAIRRHGFDPAGDPFNLIMLWLDPYIPQRAGLLPINANSRVSAKRNI